MQRTIGVLGGLILSVVALNVQAAPVTVGPWHTAGNGSATWPSYNDSVPGLELSAFSKSGWGDTTTEGYTAIQAYGFSDLHGVSYTSNPVGDIGLMPLAGNTDVTLYDFDLGIWGGVSDSVHVRIYNGDYRQLLALGPVAVGTTHGSYTSDAFSLNGLHIQIDSSPASQHAIDNIRLEDGNPLDITAEPVPAVAWLLGPGMLGLVAVARRHQS